MKKLVFAALLVMLAIGVVSFLYLGNSIEGRYHYVSAERVKASLIIKKGTYVFCLLKCTSGKYRVLTVGGSEDYILFYGDNFIDFGKSVGAPVDYDYGNKANSVRLSLYKNIFGVRLVNEDVSTGKYEYFEKDNGYLP